MLWSHQTFGVPAEIAVKTVPASQSQWLGETIVKYYTSNLREKKQWRTQINVTEYTRNLRKPSWWCIWYIFSVWVAGKSLRDRYIWISKRAWGVGGGEWLRSLRGGGGRGARSEILQYTPKFSSRFARKVLKTSLYTWKPVTFSSRFARSHQFP